MHPGIITLEEMILWLSEDVMACDHFYVRPGRLVCVYPDREKRHFSQRNHSVTYEILPDSRVNRVRGAMRRRQAWQLFQSRSERELPDEMIHYEVRIVWASVPFEIPKEKCHATV